MHRNEHSVEVERPASDVWPWLIEPERVRQWVGGMRKMEPLTEGGARVGARSRETIDVRGKAWELQSEITRLEPNELLEFRSRHEGFETHASYRLDEQDGRTRVTGRLETEYRPLFARLLGRLVTREAQKKLEADLQRLKRLAESG